MYDYAEMDKLENFLKENNYNYTRKGCWDGQQIVVYEGNEVSFDAIIHSGSHGHEDNLLEIMGKYVENDYDDIEGWLTADEIIERMKGE